MNTLYFLIPLALVLVGIAIRLFIWAVRSGQYDNLDMEGRRILFEEKQASKNPLPQDRQAEEPLE